MTSLRTSLYWLLCYYQVDFVVPYHSKSGYWGIYEDKTVRWLYP